MARRISVLQLAALLFVALAGSTATLALLEYRVKVTGLSHFQFLAWNLFLAWVPMFLALAILALHRLRAPALVLFAVAVPWLAFLPNAPYLVTDVIHLQTRWGGVPWWYDTALIACAAGTGLLLGYGALLLVQVVVTQRCGAAAGWLAAFGALLASGVGIYVGRFLRFNSWDIVSNPGPLARLTLARLEDPFGNEMLLAAVAAFATLLAAGYLVFVVAAKTVSDAARRLPVR